MCYGDDDDDGAALCVGSSEAHCINALADSESEDGDGENALL